MSVLLTFTFFWLLSRWIFLKEDRGITIEIALFKLLVEIGLIYTLFSEGAGSFMLCGLVGADFFILLMGEHGYRKERDGKLNLRWRAITALLIIGGLSLVSLHPDWNPCSEIEFKFDLLAVVSIAFLGYGTGVLFCLKEGNYIIRWICGMLKLEEKIKKGSTTGNGRFIGAFERVLFFSFLLIGAETAVTFIAAVKGLARFRHMEDDEAFAEYVIMGTFLSILLTVIVFSLAKSWVGS